MFNADEKQFILNLARQSIGYYFDNQKLLKIYVDSLPSEKLKEDLACFVTLTINGQLRGCIGHLEPIQPLYLDIIENAVGSAFDDNRFLPLTRDEFKKIKIELSVLSKPAEIKFTDSNDLLKKITPQTDGIIIKRGSYGATYLPQVWEDLPDKSEFLSSLCQKAGLAASDWNSPGTRIWKYRVEKI